MVDRAVQAGATAVTGGGATQHDKGFFFEPTVIVGADENSKIAQDEVFGPVLVVLPHDGDDDAVRIANNSKYGLSGGILAADRERALGVARRIRTGTLSVNGGMWHAADAPFGGYKTIRDWTRERCRRPRRVPADQTAGRTRLNPTERKPVLMTKILEGVRILEVAEHTFVPAASAALADFGAEVVKIEHFERGDAMRGLVMSGIADIPD